MNRELTKRYRATNVGEVALPLCITQTDGNTLVDAEGNRYLDFSSGSGVVNAGWQRPEVVEAVQAQVARLAYCAPWFPSREAVALSELLVSVTPPHLTMCGRATGGTDANELICRAAYAHTGKPGVLTLTRAYHGGSRLAVGMSDAEAFRLPLTPPSPYVHHVPAPDAFRWPEENSAVSCGRACAELVEQTLLDHPDIGLFICEPVIGSGGVIVPPEGYLARVQHICRKHGVIFALDEVITGFGRVGWMTATEGFGLEPDAVSFGKGMGGGIVPIGAAMLSTPLAQAAMRYEDVTPTFAWTPLACAAAVANIGLIIDEDLPARSMRLGAHLKSRVQDIFTQNLPQHLGEVRGQGLMVGIELITDPQTKDPAFSLMRRLVVGLLRNGLMVKVSWDFRVIILMPPLNVTQADLERGLEILDAQVLRTARSTRDKAAAS